MIVFYIVPVTKQSKGHAVAHREPELQGEIVTSVTDSTSRGDRRLVVIDCKKDEIAHNDDLPLVEKINEKDAIELARKFQPERQYKTYNSEEKKVVVLTVPALDLREYLERRQYYTY